MDSDEHVLSDEMLHGFAERAAGYDKENRFFHEDFADLQRAGYLTMAVPRELGGLGLNLAQVCREQRRLAYHAPATALGINMHVYWVGLVADLWQRGDRSLEWLLRQAMEGEVFNAEHSERGNDLPVLLSTSKAERVEGGFRITGHKMFCSMAPVWTRYGLHAMWADAEGGPKVVHAFMPRDTEGYRIAETWDTMGMRATRSDDVVLDEAFVPDRYVARIVPAGVPDAFVLGIFAWGLMGFANVYYGVAKRAIDLALPAIKTKKSLAVSRNMAYHPEIQHTVAQMMLPRTDRLHLDRGRGVVERRRLRRRLAGKMSAPNTMLSGVLADRRSRHGGVRRGRFANQLERLFRDARARYSTCVLTHEIVAGLHWASISATAAGDSSQGQEVFTPEFTILMT